MVRSLIWVSKALDTRHWENIDIPNSNDITAVRLTGSYGQLTIFNIYNDCMHANNERDLKNFLRNQADEFAAGGNRHMIWAGDFNRHHPLWDRDEDEHLFTAPARRAAEKLIGLLSDHDMVMLLPKDTPTHAVQAFLEAGQRLRLPRNSGTRYPMRSSPAPETNMH
jgi:endonuclease/exonuclease/phosphatase family metal-dependent hydrolase